MRPILILLALVLFAPSATRGQERCPQALSSAVLAAAPLDERIGFLRHSLRTERDPALAWSWTFGAVNGGLAVGQAVAAAVARGRSDKALLAAGAATSALGVSVIVFKPIVPPQEVLEPVRRGPAAETNASGQGDGTCAELRRLERALTRGARNQELGTGAAAHIGNFLINAGFGLAYGLTTKKAGPGLAAFALGFGLGETQILTQPTGLVDALDRYRAGDLDRAAGAARRDRPRLASAGLAIRVEF